MSSNKNSHDLVTGSQMLSDGFPIAWTSSATLWSVRHTETLLNRQRHRGGLLKGVIRHQILFTLWRTSFDVSSSLIAQQTLRIASRVIDRHITRWPLQYQRVFILFNCTFPSHRPSPGANGERCREHNAKTRATFSPRCSHEAAARHNQVSPLVLQRVDLVRHMTDGECTNHVPHSPQNQVGRFCNVFNA